MCWKVLAPVLSPSLPPSVCFSSRWHFHLPLPSFPIFALNAPLEPMSQLFHALAGGYALLSNLYSTHACIFILFRVSVHYRPHDILLQLRTKVERKRGRERRFDDAHIVSFFTVNGKKWTLMSLNAWTKYTLLSFTFVGYPFELFSYIPLIV